MMKKFFFIFISCCDNTYVDDIDANVNAKNIFSNLHFNRQQNTHKYTNIQPDLIGYKV